MNKETFDTALFLVSALRLHGGDTLRVPLNSSAWTAMVELKNTDVTKPLMAGFDGSLRGVECLWGEAMLAEMMEPNGSDFLTATIPMDRAWAQRELRGLSAKYPDVYEAATVAAQKLLDAWAVRG